MPSPKSLSLRIIEGVLLLLVVLVLLAAIFTVGCAPRQAARTTPLVEDSQPTPDDLQLLEDGAAQRVCVQWYVNHVDQPMVWTWRCIPSDTLRRQLFPESF